MNKGLTYVMAGLMVASLATVSFAGKGGHPIKGEVTKIEGDMVTVTDDHKKAHTFHVDATATKKEGEIIVGATVEVDADKSGHANSIKVAAAKKH